MRLALTYFENFNQKLSVESVLSLLQREPYRTQFIAALTNILHNSSNSTITTNTLQLLGRFGGKSRSLLHGRVSIPCMTSTIEGYAVVIDGRRFVLDNVLEVAVQLLERNLIAESLENTETKLASTLRTQPSTIKMMRGVRIAYKRIAIHLLEQCIIACCYQELTPIDPHLVYRLKSVVFGEPYVPDNLTKISLNLQQDQVISLIIYGLLLSCCDTEVMDEAKASVQRITTLFTALLINYSTTFRDLDGVTDFNKSAFFREKTVQRMGLPLDFLPVGFHPPHGTLCITSFFEALISLLYRDFPSVTDVVCDVVAMIWDVICQQSETKEAALYLAAPCMELFFLLSEKNVHHHDWRVHVLSLICSYLV